MARIDLHIHSINSDGSDTIKQLIKHIKESKLEIFALTDHDTFDGCIDMINLVPDNIKFIPGIELTCKADTIKCHILGYNCSFDCVELINLIAKGKFLRRNKLETRIKYLNEVWDIKLNQEELDWLYSRKSVVKTHIANILVNRGLSDDNLTAMRKYLDGCKTGNSRFDGEEAIKAIVSAGGIPVWAHPLGGEGENHLQPEEFIPKLEKMISFGIKGLECYYSRYSKDEIEFLIDCANNYNLLISGGSDYHGTNKKNINLGKLNITNTPVDSKAITLLNYLE